VPVENLPQFIRLAENPLELVSHRGISDASDDLGHRWQGFFRDPGGLDLERSPDSFGDVVAWINEGFQRALDVAEIYGSLSQSNSGLLRLPLPVPEDRDNAYDGGHHGRNQQ
jgi:hypothetical protein